MYEPQVFARKRVCEEVEDETNQISLEAARKIAPNCQADDIVEIDVTPADFPPILSILPEGSYHLYDYQFFFRNLQENVAVRLKKYLESRMKSAA